MLSGVDDKASSMDTSYVKVVEVKEVQVLDNKDKIYKMTIFDGENYNYGIFFLLI
jgi:hypothetical protein